MCGRGACTLSAERCRRVAGPRGRVRAQLRQGERLRPRYNLGPTSYVPVVRHAEGGDDCGGESGPPAREVCAMRWGLVPAFAKSAEDFDVFKGGSSTFNARVEGCASSGIWRRLVERRRGVVLLDGFYEWKASGKSKVPMFIRHRDGYAGQAIGWPCQGATEHPEPPEPPERDGARHAPLLLAALYDTWQPRGEGGGGAAAEGGKAQGEVLESTAILTMDPMGTPMAQVHDRMPVFLTPETASLWLDPTRGFADVVAPVLEASTAHAREQLLFYEVSSLVSRVGNESPDCIVPKKEYDSRQLAKGIGRFFKRKGEDATDAAEAAPSQRAAKAAKTGEGAPVAVIDLD